MTRSAPERPSVRLGQTFDYDGLLAEARAAVDESPDSQAAIAEALGVTPPVVSRALRTPGARYAGLQRRIIEAITGCVLEPVEQVVTFKFVRRVEQ